MFDQLGLLHVRWIRRGPDSTLARILDHRVVRVRPFEDRAAVQERVALTEALGAQVLWDGYGADEGSTRTPAQVQTQPAMGALFRTMVVISQPNVIVEIGTAFGTSGMFWLSGLEANGHGQLLTFEPNDSWAAIARQNLAAISPRHRAVVGTFEEHIDQVLAGRRIDLGFVDAIHKSDVVRHQFAMLVERCSPGALVVLDDINFSTDMVDSWGELARSSFALASAEVSGRVGVIELRRDAS
jgi:predicted O-methyltransferase YrrM